MAVAGLRCSTAPTSRNPPSCTPAAQVQGRGRRHLAGLAVDALHRLREVEARAGLGAEQSRDLLPEPLARRQGAGAHADREHQHHRQQARGDDQHPLQGLARAQVRKQEGEGDQGVDGLGQSLDGDVDDGDRRGCAPAAAAQHRQSPGADALSNCGTNERGRPVADPAGEQAGQERGPVGHRPPGGGAEEDRDELQGAGFEQPGPADGGDGVGGGLEPRADRQDDGETDAREEEKTGDEPADHAWPTKSAKRPSRTWRQASITSGSVSAASSSVTR